MNTIILQVTGFLLLTQGTCNFILTLPNVHQMCLYMLRLNRNYNYKGMRHLCMNVHDIQLLHSRNTTSHGLLVIDIHTPLFSFKAFALQQNT